MLLFPLELKECVFLHPTSIKGKINAEKVWGGGKYKIQCFPGLDEWENETLFKKYICADTFFFVTS